MLTPNLSALNAKNSHFVEKIVLENVATIEAWFRKQWTQFSPPVTCSVDLRHAGFKLAPVDTNLFPAGFNNLNKDLLPLAIQAAQAYITKIMPSCLNLLIIPEDHTRSEYYFKSLFELGNIFIKAGFIVKFASPNIQTIKEINIPDINENINIYPIVRKNNKLTIPDFTPCMVLLNNDLSSGIPDIYHNLEQPVLPSPNLGWAKRLKSEHFTLYQEVASEFAKLIDIDPWLINPLFTTVKNIDFMSKQGIDNLALYADNLLNQIKEKYKQYEIKERPFIAVKADNGTYGMGVIMVHDANQIINLNRKDRTRMHKVKGGLAVNQVILQEGIYTFETVKNGAVAEPVVYMIGPYVIGGFYRVHKGRGKADNLNAPGMHFAPLAFSDACNAPSTELSETQCPNRFYVYGVIARLASLASAKEAKLKEAK